MRINLQKLNPDAIAPSLATKNSACFDLYAAEDAVINPGDVVMVSTGLAVEIESGYVLKLYVRSGLAKEGIILANGTGIIDSDYRGEVKVLLANIGFDGRWFVKKGERIAQCEAQKIERIDWTIKEKLTMTERGTGGFGSTGK